MRPTRTRTVSVVLLALVGTGAVACTGTVDGGDDAAIDDATRQDSATDADLAIRADHPMPATATPDATDAGGTAPALPDSGARDAGTPPPATPPPPPANDAGPVASPPYVAPLDTAVQAHVRSVLATGVTMGNHANVFSKIGDSITESASFLGDIGHGWYDLGTYTPLAGTITAFSAYVFADGSNSFDRQSRSATAGWTTADVLAGGASSSLRTELRDARPAYAIIMLGTNDLDHWNAPTFIANMQTIVNDCESLGVVPIVSTIPDRMDAPAKEVLVIQYNAALRAFASSHDLPFVDYWAALQPLPNHGVSSDGIHPNSYLGPDHFIDTGYLTAAGLQFGYNMRNLTTLQTLDSLLRTFR